jgi:Rrf2 family protein
MKISRTVGYALKASISLAQTAPGVPISARRLASHHRLPERYLLQILRRLVSNGVLKSTAGMSGGYCLSRPPDTITLLDIVDAVESSLATDVGSEVGLSECAQERLHHSLTTIIRDVRTQLQRLRLVDLIDGPTPEGFPKSSVKIG